MRRLSSAWGDPRRADRIAAQSTHANEQRARIEGEIGRWEASADELATKTAMWGVTQVDAAMAPILRAIEDLRDELAALELPAATTVAIADAVATWTDTVTRDDFAAQRTLIRQAFPHLSVIHPRFRNGRTRWHEVLNGQLLHVTQFQVKIEPATATLQCEPGSKTRTNPETRAP